MFNRAFCRIGLRKSTLTNTLKSIPQSTLVLVNGSVQYYNLICTKLPHHSILFVSDCHYPKSKLPPTSVPVQRLHHRSTGGPTSYVALIGAYNISISPHTTLLYRVIKHFIDYSLPLAPYDPILGSTGTVLPYHGKLPTPKLHSHVWFPSTFCQSGFGARPLSSPELGSIFGLDSVLLSTVTSKSYPFPPVQILDAVLRPALSKRHESSPKSMLQLPDIPIITHTYFPDFDKFFESEDPPVVHIRSKKVYMAVYGFADASGSGFGSTITNLKGVAFRMGLWGRDDESQSSNWKEFQNVIEALESEADMGNLNGALVVLAVDNSTVESCLYKGNSSSPKLFQLILRFKKMELKTGSKFIVSHVAGERMKFQGTDGISRGCLHEDINVEGSILAFCP